MTAPTDHLDEARAALDCARGAAARPIVADRHLARAQVHATLALAEEARTSNLLAYLAWEPDQPMSAYDISLTDIVASRLGLIETENPT